MKYWTDVSLSAQRRKWCGYVLFLIFFCCIPLLTILKHQYIKTTQIQSPEPVSVHEMKTGDIVQQRLFFKGYVQKLSFWVANGAREMGSNIGNLKVTLQQDDQICTQFYDISTMGDWIYIPFEMSGYRFNPGEAILTFESVDTEVGRGIFLLFSSDLEGNLPARLNQVEQSGPLMLKYEEHVFSKTFLCSLLWMSLLLCLICWTAYLLVRESSGRWLFFSVSGIIFCALCIRVPLLTYQAEFFWEAGADFFSHAKVDDFLENLIALEGGYYLSWLTRLIAFFWVKIVGVVRFAPLAMQLTAVGISIVWCAFPCLDYFKKYASRFTRVTLSIALALAIVVEDQYTYMGFSYIGILFLIELYFVDLDALDRRSFFIYISIAILIVLTKMQYVAVIPVAAVLLCLFWKKGIRWRLYSTLLILSGLGQGLGTIALSGTSIAERGTAFGSIHFHGIVDLAESVLYQMVQLYRSVFGGNGDTSNFLFLSLIIVLALVCFIRIVQCRGKDICAWIIVLSHLLIASTFAVHRIGAVSEIGVSDVDWDVVWETTKAWRLPGWRLGGYIALLLSGICILYWFLIVKEGNKKCFSVACTAFFVFVFLVQIPQPYSTIFQDKTYAITWEAFSDRVENEEYAIQVYDGWYVSHNSHILEIPDTQLTDRGYTVNTLIKNESLSEVLTIYAKRTLTEVRLDYIAKLYDTSGQLLATVPQTNSGGRNWAGFYLDEPLSGVSYVEFELEDGSRAYTDAVEVAVVDIPNQEEGG